MCVRRMDYVKCCGVDVWTVYSVVKSMYGLSQVLWNRCMDYVKRCGIDVPTMESVVERIPSLTAQISHEIKTWRAGAHGSEPNYFNGGDLHLF